MFPILILGAAAGVAYLAHRCRLREVERDLRARLADDFHDGPLQSFAGLRMRLHAARRIAERDPAQAAVELASADAFCEEQLATMRAHLDEMRAAQAEEIDLASGLEVLVAREIYESGLEIHLKCEGVRQAPAPLLVIVKEALHNTRKHSGATSAVVRLGQVDGGIELVIEDNGRGIPEGVMPKTIARRVARLGGRLDVSGSKLTIRMPRR